MSSEVFGSCNHRTAINIDDVTSPSSWQVRVPRPPQPPLPPTPTPPTFHPDQRLQLPPVLTGNSWDSCWKSILRDCKRVHSYLCTWLFSARSTAKVMSYRVKPKSREEVWFAVSDTQHRFVFDEKNTKAGVGGGGGRGGGGGLNEAGHRINEDGRSLACERRLKSGNTGAAEGTIISASAVPYRGVMLILIPYPTRYKYVSLFQHVSDEQKKGNCPPPPPTHTHTHTNMHTYACTHVRPRMHTKARFTWVFTIISIFLSDCINEWLVIWTECAMLIKFFWYFTQLRSGFICVLAWRTGCTDFIFRETLSDVYRVSPLLSFSFFLSLSPGCVHVSIAYIVVLRTVLSLKVVGATLRWTRASSKDCKELSLPQSKPKNGPTHFVWTELMLMFQSFR